MLQPLYGCGYVLQPTLCRGLNSFQLKTLACDMRTERGIRFIDPHYQEQFRIADGEKISIKLGDGKTMERTCRYIDDYHLEVGTNLYHICEFAELCERNGHTVEPAAKENTKSAKDKEKTR